MRAVCLSALLLLTGQSGADVLRVDPAASPGGDGSSWGRAYDSLHDALAAARPGDELWVKLGQYVPRIPSSQDATFLVPAGVQLYGGFLGNETQRSQRDPDSFPTELNGDDFANTIVTIGGNNALIDGFIITEGMADGSGAAGSRGAGVYGDNVSVTLRNIEFQDNNATAGSAVTLEGNAASPSIIEHCAFQANSSGYAVQVEVPVTIINCTFRNIGSGSIQLRGAVTHSVVGSTFEDHGGFANINVNTQPGSFTEIDGCIFIDNVSSTAGAVRYFGSGTHELRNSIIRGNEGTASALGSGGVVDNLLETSDSLLIENVLFTGNKSAQGAAIRKEDAGTLTVIGCTLVGNESVGAVGAGMSVTGTGPVLIANTIIYGNIAGGNLDDERESVFVGSSASVAADRSIIEFLGGSTLLGGIDPITASLSADPMFVDADGADNVFGTADDNPRLSPGSPAIDRGNNLFVGPFVFTDVFGQTRFIDDTGTPDTGVAGGIAAIVDIGALEFQGTTPSDCVADTNGDGQLAPNDFNAWVLAFNNQLPACDQNGDGQCLPSDFNAWILNFNSGC